jgi:ribosomal protein S27AE
MTAPCPRCGGTFLAIERSPTGSTICQTCRFSAPSTQWPGTDPKHKAVRLRYDSLKPVAEGSFRVHCPLCADGVLLLMRDRQPPYKLLDHDMCVSCGQLVEWLDFASMQPMAGTP